MLGSRPTALPTVVVEDLPDDLTDPLGPEVAGWLDRVDWLRAHATDDALLDARLRLTDGVVLERYATAGDDGWVEEGTVVARAEGPLVSGAPPPLRTAERLSVACAEPLAGVWAATGATSAVSETKAARNRQIAAKPPHAAQSRADAPVALERLVTPH